MRQRFLSTVLVTLGLSVACGGEGPVRPRPEDVLSVRLTTERGVYYHSPGDTIDIQAQEAYYDWLLPRLGLELDEPLVLFKYRDRAHMLEVTGEETNGWAEVGTFRFHTIWEWDNHESVHAVLSGTVGLAPALLNEGFAVAHQTLPILDITEPVWGPTHIDTLAARFERDGQIPPLETLLRSRDFFQYDTEITYPVSGSFVRSLLERHGYGPVEEVFRISSFEASPSQFRVDFRDALGEDIETAWAAWLSTLHD